MSILLDPEKGPRYQGLQRANSNSLDWTSEGQNQSEEVSQEAWLPSTSTDVLTIARSSVCTTISVEMDKN